MAEASMDITGGTTGDGLLPPANPNRQRPRVTRACDNCKSRKMRCTGKKPCAHCIKMGKTCEYKAKYTRGAAPNIESAPQEDQVRYLEKYDWPVGNAPRRPISSHRSSTRSLSEQVLDAGNDGNESMINDERGKEFPERPYKNRRIDESYTEKTFNAQEQENGTSSERDTIVNPFDYKDDPVTGASLYERTEKKMAQRYNQQKTSVLMYGDAPFPEIDTSFFVLPPPELARQMVKKYFTESAAMTRFLHAQTVEVWTTELLNSFGNLSRGTQNNAQRAVVLMVFAFAHESMFGGSERSDTDLSFHYFHAAENQLRAETSEVCLASIQARLLQCHYLLSRSRVNQTCSILATLVNFIFVLGIHRKQSPSESDDLVSIECAKRTLWQAYVVDKYIASSLGRPVFLRDEDIDQELPLMVNDEDLLPTSLITTNSVVQSVMKAGVYHIKLAIMINKITQSFNTINKPSIATRFSISDLIMAEAQAWRDEIAHFIDLDLAPLSRIFQAQIIGLRLSYQEMLVLLFRPFLLDDFENHHYVDENGHDLSQKSKDKVAQCLKAAWAITEIINELCQRPDNFRTFWFAHYCGYQAVVPLYVYVIKNLQTGNWMPYFEAASRCQDQIKVSAAKESFSQKSSGVLEELRMEAMSHIRKSGNITPFPSAAQGTQQSTGRDGQDMRLENRVGAPSALSSTNFFGGNWSEPIFDRSAPGGGILSSLNNLDSVRRPTATGSVLDRIDTWGFSSLTGY